MSAFVSIGILLFSAVNFPAERLPGWLQALHGVLPVRWMADLVRWSLTGRYAEDVARAAVMVGLWCAGGIVVTWVLARRRP